MKSKDELALLREILVELRKLNQTCDTLNNSIERIKLEILFPTRHQ